MSILADRNESGEYEFLLTQMGIEVKSDSINKTEMDGPSFPDFLVLTDRGVTGVNNKDATELMGDLDRVEEQLRREVATCDRLCLMYRGFLTYHEDGVYAGDASYLKVKHMEGRRGNEYDVLTSTGLVFHQPYSRWLAFQWKCMDLGIPVVPVGNVRGACGFLEYLHSNPENRLFTRLIRTRTDILAEDPRHRRWLEFLTAIPGVGQEVAMAIGREFPEAHDSTALTAFVLDGGRLADIRVASGRRIGPAVGTSINKFLGIHALEAHPEAP